MRVENKIKGMTLFLLGIVYYSFFIFETYQKPFSLSIIIGYTLVTFVTIAYSFRLFRYRKSLAWTQDLIGMTLLLTQVIFLFYLTKDSDRNYFPTLFLTPLIYSALIRNIRIFLPLNLLGVGLFFLYFYIGQLFIFHLDGPRIILELLLFFAIVFVIRNYQSDCLTCTLEPNSCDHQENCPIYQAKWKRKGEGFDSFSSKS